MQAYNYLGGFGSLYITIRAPYLSRKDCMKQVPSKVGFQDNTGSQARRGQPSWDEKGALVCFLGAKFTFVSANCLIVLSQLISV